LSKASSKVLGLKPRQAMRKVVARYSSASRARSAARVTQKVGRVASGSRRATTKAITSKLVAQQAGRATKRSGVLLKKGRGVVLKVSSRANRRLLSSSGRRIVLRRLGRGILIALPAVGGIAALWTFLSDIARFLEERDKNNTSNSKPPRTAAASASSAAWVLFLGAAVADYIDMLCQCVVAHNMFWNHHEHSPQQRLLMVAAESISTACAIGSTSFAVVGEILSNTHNNSDNNEFAALSSAEGDGV